MMTKPSPWNVDRQDPKAALAYHEITQEDIDLTMELLNKCSGCHPVTSLYALLLALISIIRFAQAERGDPATPELDRLLSNSLADAFMELLKHIPDGRGILKNIKENN